MVHPSSAAPARRAVLAAALLILPVLLAPSSARGDDDESEPPRPPSAVTQVPPDLIRISTNAGATPTVFANWPGVVGGGSGGAMPHPPDPHGAVGPFGIVQSVNHEITYRLRDGENYWDTTEDFFGTGDPGIDPRVIYDRAAQRFYVTAVERHETVSYLDLAVSRSSHPLTATAADWYRYQFDITEISGATRYGGDYPALGCDSLAIYVTCNMFSLPLSRYSSFWHARVLAIDKASAIAGLTPTFKSASTPAGSWQGHTLQPASVIGAGPGNVAYFGEVDLSSTARVRVWALADPLGAATLGAVPVAVPNHGGPAYDAPQCGTSKPLDTFSPVAQGNAFWRDGSLWFCHTAGGSAGRAIVFWYRIATNGYPAGTPSLLESGFVDGGPGVWSYQAAIGGNSLGEECLVFTRSSAAMCPTLMATARQAGTDDFPPPVLVTTSPTFYDGVDWPCRWGDYGTVSADPFDETFWVSHEVAREGADTDLWGTWWGNLQFPSGIAAWIPDGVPLRASATLVQSPAAVPDGQGGAFVAWLDTRNRGMAALFLARVTAGGAIAPGWPAGGREVSSGGLVTSFSIGADSSGGVYLAWASQTTGTRIERIGATGAPAGGWPAGGVAASSASYSNPRLTVDGGGAALLAWEEAGIRAARVNPDGTLPWGAGGVPLAPSGSLPVITRDLAGGAIVAWNPDATVQRVSGAGAVLWAAGGVALAPGADMVDVGTDGVGGAYVACQAPEAGDPGYQDVFVQHVTSSGAAASGWPAGGVALSAPASDQYDPHLAADGLGGALVAWTDTRTPANSGDIYASRVLSSGAIAPGWLASGTPVCARSGDQSAPAIAADGAGGAVIAWQDRRVTYPDIYALHLSSSGHADGAMPANGTPVCTAAGVQSHPAVATVLSGSTGDALVAWEDGRRNLGCSPVGTCGFAIYAQRVPFSASDSTLAVGSGLARRIELAAPVPNPAHDGAEIRYVVPPGAAGESFSLAVFDLSGRRVATLLEGTSRGGTGRVRWEARAGAGRLAAGMYFVRLRVGSARLSRPVVLLP